MERTKKISIGLLIVIIIGHIVLYYMKEESLTSFILGVFGMICLIISIIISKKKDNEKNT